MPPTWSEDDWCQSILRYELVVKAEIIERLAVKLEHAGDFPTETPSKLSQLIKCSAKIIKDYLEATPSDQLKNLNVLLCSIAEHLRFIERSRIANTPWSMVQGTEQFLKHQTSPSTDFIIRPQWSYNYSLLGNFVEAYSTSIQGLEWIPIESWEESIGKLANESIYCISFPRIERLNCLLHANWGHEVGHIIAKKWIDNYFDQLWQAEETQIRNKIEREIQQEIQRNPPPMDPLFAKFVVQEMSAEQVNNAMQVAKQGLTELICDSIGVHLLGPAALAAAIEFSAPLSIDESPLRCDMYPPWRYRIRKMVEVCEQDLQECSVDIDVRNVKYPGPVIQPFWNWLKETTYLVQNTADIESLNSNISTREAYRVIENKWQQVKKEALNLLPDKSTEPYCLSKQVLTIEQLVHRLEQDTPPNEIGWWPKNSPSSLENIINAAWIYKIAKIQKDPDWASTDNFEKLYRLILKAIEVSFVHSTFGLKLKKLELQ